MGWMVLLTSMCASCTSADEHVGGRAEAIEGGVNDNTGGTLARARRDAAVLVGSTCTGTLVTPRLVLTAAHCTDRNSVQMGPTTSPASPVRVRVLRCLPLTGYSSCPAATPPTSDDIALLVLAERVDADPATGTARTGVWNAIPMAVRTTDPAVDGRAVRSPR